VLVHLSYTFICDVHNFLTIHFCAVNYRTWSKHWCWLIRCRCKMFG